MSFRWRDFAADLVAAGLVLSVYGALALPQLDLPGLYYDEAVDAVPAMQALQRRPVELVRDAGVTVRGRTLPLMAMDYVGAMHTYAVLPFFYTMGVGAVPLRLMTVAGGALTLIFTYALGRLLFNRPVAFLGALLLAVHPSFLFYVRQGVHVSSLLAVFTTGSLFAVGMWWRTRRGVWLAMGTLFLGLGLTTKILFMWFINAILAAFGLRLVWWMLSRFPRRPVKGRPSIAASVVAERETEPASAVLSDAPRITASQVGVRLVAAAVTALAAAITFLAGAGPLLLYNLRTGGTLQVIADNRGITQSGVDNSAYLTNLPARLETARALLDGGHFWFLGGIFGFSPYPWLFLSLVAALPVLLWLNRRRVPGFAGPAALLVFLIVTVTLHSVYTVAGIWPTHLFFLLPFVTLLAAAALWLVAWRLPGKAIAGGLALVLLAGSVQVDLRYHQALADTGGRRAHSDAIYRLASFVEERGDPLPFAMDWGMKANLQIVTQGRVNPQEIFFYSPEPPPPFTDWLYGATHREERHLFIFHAPDATVFPRLGHFLDLTRTWEQEAILEATVRERDGTPVYLVYAVR